MTVGELIELLKNVSPEINVKFTLAIDDEICLYEPEVLNGCVFNSEFLIPMSECLGIIS